MTGASASPPKTSDKTRHVVCIDLTQDNKPLQRRHALLTPLSPLAHKPTCARLNKRPREEDTSPLPRPQRQRQNVTLRYPEGYFPKSRSFSSPGVYAVRLLDNPRHNDVTLEELLDIKTTDEVVLCSYAWHPTWLIETMRLNSVKSTWIVDSRSVKGQTTRQEPNGKPRKCGNRTIHHPPHLRLYGTCHAKFFISFRKNGTLRVVVTSANLTPVEWGHKDHADGREKASTLMDNVAFVVDLPLRTTMVALSTRPDFQTEFHDFLQCLQVQPSLLAAINRYDFSACAHLGFVYTGYVALV